MDMKKATLYNFYLFIENEVLKDPDRPITQKHWCDCAVGDFAREVLGYDDDPLNFDALATTLFGEETDLYEYMGNETDYDLPETYGGLNAALDYIEDRGEMNDGFIS